MIGPPALPYFSHLPCLRLNRFRPFHAMWRHERGRSRRLFLSELWRLRRLETFRRLNLDVGVAVDSGPGRNEMADNDVFLQP